MTGDLDEVRAALGAAMAATCERNPITPRGAILVVNAIGDCLGEPPCRACQRVIACRSDLARAVAAAARRGAP